MASWRDDDSWIDRARSEVYRFDCVHCPLVNVGCKHMVDSFHGKLPGMWMQLPVDPSQIEWDWAWRCSRSETE